MNFQSYNFVEYVRFDVIESEKVIYPHHSRYNSKKHIKLKIKIILTENLIYTCKGLNYVYTIYSRMGGGKSS